VPPPGVSGDLPRIDYPMFEIPPTGLDPEQRERALAALRRFVDVQHDHFMGFQANQDQRYSDRLAWLLDMHTNNIGDPYQTGAFTLNTKFCERAIIDYFAALWNCDWPHNDDDPIKRDPERAWGYVLTMGFTEGNIYGLYNARDYLKGRQLLEDPDTSAKIDARLAAGKEAPIKKHVYAEPLPRDDSRNAYTPIVFYSEDVHYSVVKAVRLLELRTFYQEGMARYPGQSPIGGGQWPEEVPSHDFDKDNPLSGSIKIDDLEKLVRFFVERGYPVLIVANMGTTWKGAYDDVEAIDRMLVELGKEFPWLWQRQVHYDGGHTDMRRGFWLHVDGALGAAYLPFIEMAHNRGLIDRKGPSFDFRNPAVMSIGCSMHKWIGGPWPSGVFMTRKGYQLLPPDEPGFLGALDTTLGGSRSGFSPVILWDYFSRMSYQANMQKALDTEDVAAYLEQELRDLEARLHARFPDDPIDLWIARSRLALTVRFRQTSDTINYQWTLDTDTLWVPIDTEHKQLRSYSHVFVMHSVSKERVDAFIAELWELARDDWHKAFPADIDGNPNPGPVESRVTDSSAPRSSHIVPVPFSGRGFGSARRSRPKR
jgi:histidine decarboxylase